MGVPTGYGNDVSLVFYWDSMLALLLGFPGDQDESGGGHRLLRGGTLVVPGVSPAVHLSRLTDRSTVFGATSNILYCDTLKFLNEKLYL